MNDDREITYALDFAVVAPRRRRGKRSCEGALPEEAAAQPIPRIARLMALAIRFERLVQEGTIRDYAELGRLGRVTRARMTQIMRLLHLAPDIQEQLLFLPPMDGFNESNLRAVVEPIDWAEQRLRFQGIKERCLALSAKGCTNSELP